jgi:hypothetical protein
MNEDKMLRWFQYNHLPEDLQSISKVFASLAIFINDNITPSAERTVALRKLLESKDAAVRAYIETKENN